MKRSLTFCLVVAVFCSFFSPASFGSEKQFSFSIAPREFAVYQIQDNEVVPFETYQYILPEIAQKAVQASPLWLQEGLITTFQDLDRRPAQIEGKSKPAFGDVNHDSFRDFVLISSTGECNIYLDQGFSYQHCTRKTTSFLIQLPDSDPSEEKLVSFFSPSLFDINQDGYDDLFFGYSNCLYYCKNNSMKEQVSFDSPVLIYTPSIEEEDPPTDPEQISEEEDEEKEEEQPEAFSPFVFSLNEVPSMVVGKKDGSLFLLTLEKQENNSFLWVEKPSYFASWNEHWQEEPEKEGAAVHDYASPCILPFSSTHPNLQLMCVGSASGNFSFFLIHVNSMLPQIQTIQMFPSFETPQWTSPTFEDINRDGRIDFVFGAASGKIYYILNGGNSVQISWNPLDSKAEMNNLKNFFGGIGYHRAYDTLYCVGNNVSLIKEVSAFILEVEPTFQDEVIYCLANFQTTDIIQYFQAGIQNVLIENAKGIYDIAQQVKYCSLLEEDGYTTLQYKTRFSSDGKKTDTVFEKTLPKEIYYNYLVMFNRYLLVPTRWESFYEKNFYRTYLPYDKTYVHNEEEKTDQTPSSVTLLERVKDAETLYDAAWHIMFWLKDDIGGVWHTGEKPPGWYNIYHNLLNKEVGIWCGEWSIIYEACARAMNIPTIIIIGLGEDHQYNNFYDSGWHHVDPSAGESGDTGTWEPYIGNSLVYYENWGNRIFSWPMEWEGNGKYDHVWRSSLPYNPPEKLTNLSFTVVDKNHHPVEGARIELWSHWPMENKYAPVPFPSAFGYTDSFGTSSIQKVGHQNFTCVVTSRIGTSSFYIPLRDANDTPELSYSVVLSEEIQPLYKYYNAVEPNFIIDSIDPLRIPVSEEHPEPFFDEEKQLYYCPISLLIEAGCRVKVEEKTATIQSEEHTLVLTAEQTTAILDGKEIALQEHQVPIMYMNTIYICFSTTLLIEIDTRFNEIQKQYVLYILSSRLCSIQFDNMQAIQKNHHWIDGYTTSLEYIDYWKPSTASLDCIVLPDNELWSLLHGESVMQCDWTTIKSTAIKPAFGSTLHKEGNYYIVLMNPNFATTLSGEISFQIHP
jgi:hypothetical protein